MLAVLFICHHMCIIIFERTVAETLAPKCLDYCSGRFLERGNESVDLLPGTIVLTYCICIDECLCCSFFVYCIYCFS
jgi:hypothetical protein